ncbi:MAG: hypothetical protein M0008_00445 [Actinomycetota bacterium]|nr:hypothetical protein [Actinomycetota bacterium]
MMVRTPKHRAALEKVVLGQFSTARPCDRKAIRPARPLSLNRVPHTTGPSRISCDSHASRSARSVRSGQRSGGPAVRCGGRGKGAMESAGLVLG